MTRDIAIFLGFLSLFIAVNLFLIYTGDLPVDARGLGIMVAAGITLALYSFLYKDNPLFKFAEHFYVGVAAAYTLNQLWYQVILADVFNPLFGLNNTEVEWARIFPAILGLLMLTQLGPSSISWLSRISFAFVVGLGAGLAIPRTISANLLAQIQPSIQPLSLTAEGFNLLVILVGVTTVLIYFFYSVEHTGAVGAASKVGIYFLMVSFGASFGYTIMARLSLLIGRMDFLLSDWLALKLPLF